MLSVCSLVSGPNFFCACSPTGSMCIARADRAAGPRAGQGSMRNKHTASLARCEVARNEPAADPGQTCPVHRLAATSRSLTIAGDLSVPFARAVVKIRGCGFDGHTEALRLRVPVKTAPSSDQTRARKRYRPVHAYVAATFIGTFFSLYPLTEA